MSKYIIFEFRCQNSDCGEKFDAMVKPDIKTAQCPHCESEGTRIVSMGRIDPKLGAQSDVFGTMADKWARTREQHSRVLAKKRDSHGPEATITGSND